MSTVQQLQLPQRGERLTVVSVERPTPSPDEVCIRAKAVALNPLDWKNRAFGIVVPAWPAVLGVDGAGIVEAVGDAVKDFKVGDEVLSLCGMAARAGAFQEIITVPVNLVAKKPASLSFEEAASLPICYLTAAASVSGLGVPLTHLDPTGSSSLKSILVVGGSSGVGAGAIQLLRMALPSATILTTSSPQHHERLLALGATQCFDRSAQEDTSAIRAATPDGAGVDAILDAVAATATEPSIFSALNPAGPKLVSHPVTGQDPQAPEGVQIRPVMGRQVFASKGGHAAMSALTGLVESGKYKLPTKIEVVGKGLDAISPGLDRLMKGVSGTKLVVSL